MKRMLILSLAALCLALAAPASAKVDVITANEDLAWVTRAVGGNLVSVDYLASSNQDPHVIEPRPSQVAKLSRAKLLVRIGMDLDIWLDTLLRRAGNGNIMPNGRGYVDASRGVRILEIPVGKLDPSQGDIHIWGNPHYMFGPGNIPAVARNVRDGLKRVDVGNSAAYDANYEALVARINQSLPRWKAKLAPAKGKLVVTYHRSFVYFLSEFGLREAANVEPRPGLEPTPSHINSTAKDMKQLGIKVIITENWRPRRYTDLLARQSGAAIVVVPGGVGAEKGLNDYFAFMDAFVDRVADALK